MTTAIYPGSFDPVTYGHLDIIERAAEVFDQVIVGVLKNQSKNPLFDFDERVEMIREVTKGLDNVKVVSFQGLLIDFTKELNPDVETMFFATSEKYSFLSSSTVRELAYFDGDITPFVPDYVREKVQDKVAKMQK